LRIFQCKKIIQGREKIISHGPKPITEDERSFVEVTRIRVIWIMKAM